MPHIRVLVIEDNPGDFDLVVEMLGREPESDVALEHASDLAAGLLALGDRTPDAILLDLGLPDSQGLDTLRGIRREVADVPVVVLTGNDDPAEALEAVRQGADDFLVKGGFQAEQLRRTLRHAIERKKSEVTARDETRLVETLHEVGASLASELDLETLVQSVTDAATELASAEFGAFFYNMTSAAGDAYMLYTISGVPREAFSRFPMPRATALFGPTFRGDGVVRLDDVTADARYGHSAPYYGMPKGHLPVRSYLAVPVISRSGEVIGGLFFGHSEVGRFTERHERLIGGVAGWAALAIDNARLYEEAQRAIQARDDVLNVVSHDLRNMLSNVTMAAHVLRQPALSPDRKEQYLSTIDRAGQSMRRLIDDLLDAARLERGELSLRKAEQQAADLLDDARTAFEEAARDKTVELVFAADADLPPIEVDGERVLQVLGNLVGNALKFTPAEGRIEVAAAADGQAVRFSVRDTGPGIDEQDLPRLFERFYRGRNHVSDGVGLGLAICHGIVTAHGGRIWVDSRKGQGAAFHFTVPLAPALEERS